jgi:hypothetical protein
MSSVSGHLDIKKESHSDSLGLNSDQSSDMKGFIMTHLA